MAKTYRSKTEYEKSRNALIPIAEKYANRLHPEPSQTDKGKNGKNRNPVTEAWENAWNRCFHGKMEELWQLGR
jgi:hypothetical protein